MLIRNVEIRDVEAFWEMQSALDNETKFMMYEPGEREKDIVAVENVIARAASGDDLLLIAEESNEIAGYIYAQRGTLRRIRHSAYIVVGIREAYQHKGIGTEFFAQLISWAEQSGIVRLELTVMSPNVNARHLYEKFGFVIEGTKRLSMLVDGNYVDEFYMAKII